MAVDFEKMGRVLIVSASPLEQGGLAKRTQLVARGLAAKGWQVRMICRGGSLRWPRITREPNSIALHIPGWSRRRLGLLAFICVGVPCGLVWAVHSRAILGLQVFSPSLLAALIGRVLRKPTAVWTSTSGELGEAHSLKEPPLAGFKEFLLRGCSVLIAQTPQVEMEFLGAGLGLSTFIIPNPVEAGEPSELNGHPRVLFMGRFSAEKQLDMLLAAWEELAAERPTIRLFLAGSGTGFRDVEQTLRIRVAQSPHLKATVRTTGWIDDPFPLLARCDVFVLPSRSEGMSNALLEACACGRVVVASDIPGNKNVLGEGYPLYFACGDRESLRRALDTALLDVEVRTQARSGVVDRARAFSVSDVTGRLSLLLDAISTHSK